jgi:hypothetical protein
MPGTRNARAMTITIRSLRALGRVEPVDDALLALCRSTAAHLDAAEAGSAAAASCARAHTVALDRLRGLSGDVDRFDLLGSLAVPPTMGDAADT